MSVHREELLPALMQELALALPGNPTNTASLWRAVLLALIYLVENTPEKKR